MTASRGLPVVTSDLVLYQYPGGEGLPSLSPPCLKVQLALRRLDLAYFVVDLRSPWHVSRLSPTGRVPVVSFGNRLVTDSVAILDALEARDPACSPFPRGGLERVNDRLVEHFATDTLYWLGYHQRWLDPVAAGRMLDAAMGKAPSLERLAARLFFLPTLRQRARAQGVGARTPEDVRAATAGALDLLETAVGAGPFLFGRKEPGRGDLAVAAHLAQAGFAGATPAFLEAVRARPALLRCTRETLQACRTALPPWLAT